MFVQCPCMQCMNCLRFPVFTPAPIHPLAQTFTRRLFKAHLGPNLPASVSSDQRLSMRGRSSQLARLLITEVNRQRRLQFCTLIRDASCFHSTRLGAHMAPAALMLPNTTPPPQTPCTPKCKKGQTRFDRCLFGRCLAVEEVGWGLRICFCDRTSVLPESLKHETTLEIWRSVHGEVSPCKSWFIRCCALHCLPLS